jgi:hypothetical protein
MNSGNQIHQGQAVGLKENVSEQLLTMAGNLAEQISTLSDRVNNRLQTISRPEMPRDPTKGEAALPEEWPPYFSKVRASLYVIQTNIYNISSAIDRLEV